MGIEPTRTLVAPHTGFEVRGTHQDPSASTGTIAHSQRYEQ